jgi:hypothetical protein
MKTTPPTRDDFSTVLREILNKAKCDRLPHLTVLARDLHLKVGGYPNKGNHRMPICCGVMRDFMHHYDLVSYAEELEQPPKGNGATLKIRYELSKGGIQEA